MKKCAACILTLVIFFAALAPGACAAGFALPEDVQITAQAVYVLNLDTGLAVYEREADTPRSVASLTKLMTALLLIENVPDLEGTSICAERQLYVGELISGYASNADIRPGEHVRALDMLYAMMLPSANEAAEAVGFYLSGGNLDNFYALMNARAAELGCTNTQFASTNGLVDQDGGNWSTAHDIALIAQACWQHEIFRTVCGTALYWMPFTDYHTSAQYPEQNPDAAYYIQNTNLMIKPNMDVYRGYIKGVKTGSTEAAGRNFCSAAVNDAGESFIGVVLGAPWEPNSDTGIAYSLYDTAALYDWIFANFSVRPTLNTDTPITEVKLRYSRETDTLRLVPADDLKTILPNDSDSLLEQIFDVPENGVEAPVAAGDKIGSVTIKLSGEVLGTVDLLAAQDVGRSTGLYVLAKIQEFFKSLYFRVVLILTALFLAGYALLVWTLHKREAARRRRRRPPSDPRHYR